MPRLFQLTTGIMVWTSETPYVQPCADEVTFTAKDTAILVPSSRPGELTIVKMSEDIGKPEQVAYPMSAIVSARECRDEDLNMKCRSALAGLVLAK